MLPLGTPALAAALDNLRRAVEFQEFVRLHFSEEADLSELAQQKGATRYVEARNGSPSAPTFQVYVHCGSITRLYAIYEAFVYELARSWLREICALCVEWVDLPEALRKNYRSGVGILLQKYGGPRTAHLTEMKIIESLHKAFSGESNLELIPDAFFIELHNLREDELLTLFSRIGLPDLATWLTNHPEIHAHCEQQGMTVGSALKELVAYRNDAAHGEIEVDEVLGVSELLSIVDFIQILCCSLGEFVRAELVDRAKAKGRYVVAGRVTEFFGGPQASIAKMQKVRVRLGDGFIARSATQCFLTSVKSIQVNGNSVEVVDTIQDQELGLCLSPAVRRGLELISPVMAESDTLLSGAGA